MKQRPNGIWSNACLVHCSPQSLHTLHFPSCPMSYSSRKMPIIPVPIYMLHSIIPVGKLQLGLRWITIHSLLHFCPTRSMNEYKSTVNNSMGPGHAWSGTMKTSGIVKRVLDDHMIIACLTNYHTSAQYRWCIQYMQFNCKIKDEIMYHSSVYRVCDHRESITYVSLG